MMHSLFVTEDIENDSISNSDEEQEEEFNEKSHNKLLEDINKLSGRKRGKIVKAVRSSSNVTSLIKNANLLKKISNPGIKPGKKLTNKLQTLPKPLEKPAANRIRRTAGFEKLSIEVNKWEKLVHIRRKADQLKFPLQEVDVRVQTTEKLRTIEPKSDLQKKVYELLHGANMIQKKQETENERIMKRAMSLEEVKEKNREMWRARELRQRMERKAARQNATKSKKFHKLLRKERVKKQKAEIELLVKDDPEAAEEKMKELDDIRIQERMSLRHRRSRWAHLQGLRATHDKTSLAAVTENKRLHNEMKQRAFKRNLNNDDEDNEEKEKESEIEDDDEMDIDTPWNDKKSKKDKKQTQNEDVSFMKLKQFWDEFHQQKLKALQNQEKEISNSSTTNLPKSKTPNHGSELLPVVTMEHDFACTNDEENLDETLNIESSAVEDTDLSKRVQNKTSIGGENKKNDKDSKAKNVLIDPTALMQVKSQKLSFSKNKLSNLASEVLDDDEDDSDDTEEDAEDYIHDALADDYLIDDFKNAKKDAVDKNALLINTLAMPGWGDWGGQGISVSKRKARKHRMRTPRAPPRKDSTIGNVIYNEDADVHGNLRKAMVSELPYPFNRVKDFEASVRAPLGRSFVPENVHRKLVAPPVITKLGTVIEPMDEEALLNDKRKNYRPNKNKRAYNKNKK